MSAKKSTATKAKKASSASQFKKARRAIALDLPSGLTVLARRVDIRTFISKGDVPNPLMPIVEEALQKGNASNVQAIVGDGETPVDMNMVNDMYEMVETVVMSAVMEPTVHPNPDEGVEADDDLVYISDVDDEDKMFIFQWTMGGTDDIARFRAEAQKDLASLAQGEGSGSSPK